MDVEDVLYWKIMCKHLHAEAQVDAELFFSFCATFSWLETCKNEITNIALLSTVPAL
jgi:hypothetical protein